MTLKIDARESTGYSQIWTIGGGDGPVDITGWTFSLKLQRQAGVVDVTLGMAGAYNPATEGMFVYDGLTGQLFVRILPATLSGIADTTGDFTMYGDLLGTPPGLPQMFLKAIEARITTMGPWPA